MKFKVAKSVLGCLLAVAACGAANAKEGGDQYPNGAENWMAGALPPPGSYFVDYAGYYGGKLRNGDGDKVKGAKVDAWFNAFRYVHVTETKLLGGDYAWHVIVPVVHQKLSLGGPSQTVTGLGDITINPFILGWHSKNLHTVIGLDILLPTGRYDSHDARRSIGANYLSFEPVFAATYLSDTGIELSGKFMYNIKTKNKSYRPPVAGAPKMDYRSGDEFHMDFLVAKRMGDWGVGLAGYYLQQTTADKVDGKTIAAEPGLWSKGRKGRVLAFGPTVSYTTKTGMSFSAQWHHETLVKNRFGGDKFMLKFAMPL